MATAAPGVREILTVGKLCYEVRERNYDLVVVDAPASGHVIGQLAAPQAINNLVKVGLIRNQTDWMLDILSDRHQTGLVAVCTPEEMPVNETIELAERVREETTVRLSAVVVDRVLPELFGRQEEVVFDALGRPGPLGILDDLVGGEAGPVFDAARLAVTMRRTRTTHLDRSATGSTVVSPCSTCRTSSPARTGCAPPGRSPPPWARSSATDGRGPITPVRTRRPDRTRRRGRGEQATEGAKVSSAGSGSMDGLLATKEIVVACGPGGVGKTTTAAAAAIMAAIRHGSKVLVLTVDPARRLADALGLDGIGNTEHRVPDEAFRAAGIKLRGQLWAAMLDTKESLGRRSSDGMPRTPRPGTRSWPIRSTRTSPAGSCRATTTSPWSGSTRSTPRATTTSSWWTPRPPATPSTSSTPRSAWPTSSPPACCGG